MKPEFESCSLLLLYWGMLFTFSLRLLSKSELAVKPNADGAPIPNAGEASVDADVRGIVIGSTWRLG